MVACADTYNRSGLSQRGEIQRVITGLNLGAAPSNVANDSMETAAGRAPVYPSLRHFQMCLKVTSPFHRPARAAEGRSHAGRSRGGGGEAGRGRLLLPGPGEGLDSGTGLCNLPPRSCQRSGCFPLPVRYKYIRPLLIAPRREPLAPDCD